MIKKCGDLMSLIMIPYMMAWVCFQQMDLEKSLRKNDDS